MQNEINFYQEMVSEHRLQEYSKAVQKKAIQGNKVGGKEQL